MKNDHHKEEFAVIVVGGGAAGLMAAGQAAALGHRVLLLEKNRVLGEKLNITGGGRCNITKACFDQQLFLSAYGPAKDFLFSPFSQFGVKETFDFFDKLGLPLVVEARQRAFPKTQRARDVTLALEKYAKKQGAILRVGSPVTKILVAKKKIIGVRVGKTEYRSRSLILATGGLSHPETGSTGDGFRWLTDLGHTVRAASPNIVPLAVSDLWVKELAGLSLSFMKITFYLDGVKVFSKTGKILFTHFGLSGPLILNNAHLVKKLLTQGKVSATIDVFPHTDLGSLAKQILKVLDANKNKDLKSIFKEIAPAGMAEAVLALLPIVPKTKGHSITKEQRQAIARLLKTLPVRISGLMGYDRAVVSDGGVPLTEIDVRAMRSKFYPNLFILGDLLDINRPSGGYSLQLCWTTGFVAARHLAEILAKN